MDMLLLIITIGLLRCSEPTNKKEILNINKNKFNVFVQDTLNQKDKKGFKQGYWMEVDSGNKIKYLNKYKNGNLNGECKVFDWQDKITSKVNFTNGIKHGDYILYNSYGDPIEIYKHEKGVIRYKAKFDSLGNKFDEKYFDEKGKRNVGSGIRPDKK